MASPIVDAVAGFGLALIKPVTDLISEAIEDKDKAAALAHEIATLAQNQAHSVQMGQLEVNRTEAVHKAIFVAGWRPFIGWTCGVAMGFNYIVTPIVGAFGINMPVLDITTMFPVLLGMLGLAGMRSFEKDKGVSREQ